MPDRTAAPRSGHLAGGDPADAVDTQRTERRRAGSEQHDRWRRAHGDGVTPATLLAAILGLRTQVGVGAMGHTLTGRYGCAHACRDGEVVCGRVELIVRADVRLGLTARERRCVAVRFVEHLHPVLRAELAELVRRRGAVARRAAERMQPIEVVIDDPRLGLQRIIGWVQPPQLRRGDLHEIEFALHEPAP